MKKVFGLAPPRPWRRPPCWLAVAKPITSLAAQLPPSKLVNRVMIAVQNPSIYSKGQLIIVDAFYDSRSCYNQSIPAFAIAGYGGNLPVSHPEHAGRAE